MILLIDFLLNGSEGIWLFDFLDKVAFFRWGWLFVFGLAGSALVGAIRWKSVNLVIRKIVVCFSIIALIVAAPWFWMMCLFELPA